MGLSGLLGTASLVAYFTNHSMKFSVHAQATTIKETHTHSHTQYMAPTSHTSTDALMPTELTRKSLKDMGTFAKPSIQPKHIVD